MFNTAILFFENASMGIITQGIEKITCRWDSTLNMVKYNHNMRSEVYSMKKLFKVFSLMLVVIMAFPFSVMASENDQQRSAFGQYIYSFFISIYFLLVREKGICR